VSTKAATQTKESCRFIGVRRAIPSVAPEFSTQRQSHPVIWR
jgi:hypothetical protein